MAAGALGLTVVPAGAGAVIGGERVDASAVPWFISFPTLGCGGTLVAVDRVITAAHCVGGFQPADVGRIRVGRQVRRVVHFALAPGWENATHDTYFPDDIAIVGLNAPVTRVRPVPLAAPGVRLPRRVRLLGRGRTAAPGHGGNEQGQLREARLASVGDSACARVWRRHPRHPEPFSAARMLCAIDADGRPPLSSGCHGDSGGPVLRDRPPAAAAGRDQLGRRQLRRRSPAERVRRGRPLPHVRARAQTRLGTAADQPAPASPATRAPAARSPAPRPRTTLPVDAVTFQWLDRDFAVVATGPSYTVQPRDSGRAISCQVTATTAGGPTTTTANVTIAH